MIERTLDRIQELYEEGLKAKTNWGRNDVLALYKDCVLKTLKENADIGSTSLPVRPLKVGEKRV